MAELAQGFRFAHTTAAIEDDKLPARSLIAALQEVQFCFSSDLLCRRLEAYILDNYGDGNTSATTGGDSGSRFCIMPDDNSVVCLCDRCRRAGNTPQNATPAVMALLRRIADRFPAHLFFTTSYLTTETAPATRMPCLGLHA